MDWANAVQKFVSTVEKFHKPSGLPTFFDNPENSAIQIVQNEMVQKMTACHFQQILRKSHIIIRDHNLPYIPCDCCGLMSFNGLKEHWNSYSWERKKMEGK